MKMFQTFDTEPLSDLASRRRRLLMTPSYFFVIWRWTTWLYALIVILGSNHSSPKHYFNLPLMIILFSVTLLQTLTITIYAPAMEILFPMLAGRKKSSGRTSQKIHNESDIASDENADELFSFIPFVRSHKILVYGLDVVVCGLVMYLSAPLFDPPFGSGSVFYRYGMSTVLAAASAYGYRGGLLAAFGYDLFAVLGIVIHAPGFDPAYFAAISNHSFTLDVLGSVIDAPIIAVIAGYFISIIKSYESRNVRLQRSLVTVGQTLLQGTHDRQELLDRSAKQILEGGFFERVVILLITTLATEKENQEKRPKKYLVQKTLPSAQGLPDDYENMVNHVLQTHQKYITFQPSTGDEKSRSGLARFYMPLDKDEQTHIILGAESRRSHPFSERQEIFLEIAGGQLLIALDNIRLTERMVEIAAKAERERIAREIHDGIAQLVYMLSLNAETCQTQAQRLAEETELVAPLADRLGRLVTISKQALLETRNSMFSLKPLMSGTTTLTQTLTNLVREFETISDLPTTIEISGEEAQLTSKKRQEQRYTQLAGALFRILQEALFNIYKHAKATQVKVKLQFLQDQIILEVCDNGLGFLPTLPDESRTAAQTIQPSIYSGNGIENMQKRVAELGGKVSIHPCQTGGTIVSIELPL